MNMHTVRPEDFATEYPPDRIIGTECEYSIQPPEWVEQSEDSDKSFNKFLSNFVDEEALENVGMEMTVSGFLSNGGRIYTDVRHVEYCSQECLGPSQAAAADLAGSLLVRNIVEASKLPHRGVHRTSGTTIGRGVYSDILSGYIESTRGYHENYLIPGYVFNKSHLGRVLPSFLASRVWAMGGTLRQKYELSQKVADIGDDPISYNDGRHTTRGEKPMAMIRDFDDAYNEVDSTHDWRRLEVRYADPCHSPTAKFLGFAATSLTLRIIENPAAQKYMKEIYDNLFSHPVEAAHKFGGYVDFNKTEETISGRNITALDFQEILQGAAYDLSERIDIPDEELDAIELWGEIIDKLRLSDPSNVEYDSDLIYTLDFAAKHYYIASRIDERDIHSGNIDAVKRSLVWDRIAPEGGASLWWARHTSDYVSEDETRYLTKNPPEETRANIRGRIIEESPEFVEDATWERVIIDSDSHIKLSDPYNSDEVEIIDR